MSVRTQLAERLPAPLTHATGARPTVPRPRPPLERPALTEALAAAGVADTLAAMRRCIPAVDPATAARAAAWDAWTVEDYYFSESHFA